MAWHRQRVRQSANVPVSGIAGYWGYAAHDIPATVFAGFVDSLAHRGPDGSGINHFPDMRLWLGHRRLSLLEPALEGRQPLADTKRRYWLTFDGTIYNEHTLRHQLRALGHSFASRSSAEMVLAAYAQWGADCLRRFDGIWAVAILDSRDRRLLLNGKPLRICGVNRHDHDDVRGRAVTRPAGVSSRSTPGIFGFTSPFSMAKVTVPMVPWPHIGRQPEVSMNRIATSQSSRVGG